MSNFMYKMPMAVLGLLILLSPLGAQKNLEFKNGFWFNGKDFVAGNWYVSNGVFSKKAPSKIDTVIDLDNRWVVPAMADAFCTSLAENPNAANTVKMYMDEGVFYLQVLGNTQASRKELGNHLNTATSPDAAFANGAITCTLGYPFLQYEGPANNVRNPKMMTDRYDQIKLLRKMHGDGYWYIDNKESLSANWDKIKAQKPQVLSIYLLDAEKSGGKEGKGLTPDMAKAVIKKAHKADIRVFAHVETVEDVRLGIQLGVDGFANLPGYNWDGSGDSKKFELSDEDLKKLAKKQIAVVPLFSHAQSALPRPNVMEYQKQTIKRFLAAGVNIVAGSNDQQRTIRTEVNYWFQLGELSALQVIKILCENTPKAIFPDRKIGKIENGYEANFVVLNDNPLTNLLKLRAISFKVKKGKVIR